MLIPIRQSRARLAAASKARRLIMHYTAEISEMPGCHFRGSAVHYYVDDVDNERM